MDFNLIENLSDYDIQTLYNDLIETDNKVSGDVNTYIEITCENRYVAYNNRAYGAGYCGSATFNIVGYNGFNCNLFVPEKKAACGYYCAYAKVISCRYMP